MRVHLVHWDAAAGKALAKKYGFAFGISKQPPFLRKLAKNPPDAVVIDLTRAPSQGRDVACWLRSRKSTRHVPVIFLEGEAEKLAGIRKLLPDALYGSWKQIRTLLRKARPLQAPVLVASVLAGYSATPLPKKLGIKPGVTVGLQDPPGHAHKLLGAFEEAEPDRCDLLLWWVRSRNDFLAGIRSVTAPRVWIFWPKAASGVKTDIKPQEIRETGLALGLVDYKVCAFDKTWSGLLFSRRTK